MLVCTIRLKRSGEMMATNGSAGVGGLVVAGLIIFGAAHGCAGAGASDYHSHDTVVTNPDGSTTYTNNYDVNGDSGSFSCTSTADYSSTDCSGNP